MNSISAQEIKRRGISAVDEALAQGPVHIIKDNRPQYVVLSEERYKAPHYPQRARCPKLSFFF